MENSTRQQQRQAAMKGISKQFEVLMNSAKHFSSQDLKNILSYNRLDVNLTTRENFKHAYKEFADSYNEAMKLYNDDKKHSICRTLEEETERDEIVLRGTMVQHYGVLVEAIENPRSGRQDRRKLEELEEEYKKITERLYASRALMEATKTSSLNVNDTYSMPAAYMFSGHGMRTVVRGNSNKVNELYSAIEGSTKFRFAATHGIKVANDGSVNEKKLGFWKNVRKTVSNLFKREHRGMNFDLGLRNEEYQDSAGDTKKIGEVEGGCGHMYIHKPVINGDTAAIMFGVEGSAPPFYNGLFASAPVGRSGTHDASATSDPISPSGGRKTEQLVYFEVMNGEGVEKLFNNEQVPEGFKKEEIEDELLELFKKQIKKGYNKSQNRYNFSKTVTIEVEKEELQKPFDGLWDRFIEARKNPEHNIYKVPLRYNSASIEVTDDFDLKDLGLSKEQPLQGLDFGKFFDREFEYQNRAERNAVEFEGMEHELKSNLTTQSFEGEGPDKDSKNKYKDLLEKIQNIKIDWGRFSKTSSFRDDDIKVLFNNKKTNEEFVQNIAEETYKKHEEKIQNIFSEEAKEFFSGKDTRNTGFGIKASFEYSEDGEYSLQINEVVMNSFADSLGLKKGNTIKLNLNQIRNSGKYKEITDDNKLIMRITTDIRKCDLDVIKDVFDISEERMKAVKDKEPGIFISSATGIDKRVCITGEQMRQVEREREGRGMGAS